MNVKILASGSKGNCLLIESNNNYIMIDVGISFKKIKEKISKINVKEEAIKALFITHEHKDHIAGLKMLLTKLKGIKVFLTAGTYKALKMDVIEILDNFVIIKSEEEIMLKNEILIIPFELSHDANEPVGFIIKKGKKKIVLITDTGYVDEYYYNMLKNADLYILEANHSAKMLINSNRPQAIKMRILGEKGHLSNDDASWLINEFTKNKDYAIWVVAHISDDCNSLGEIKKTINKIIENPAKLKILYSSQETLENIKLW